MQWLKILKLVKLQHALFALPLTLIAVIVASEGRPDWLKFFWVLVAFLSARSLGMGLNRLLDSGIDAKNPRTSHRLMASGELGKKEVLPWLLGFGVFFFVACLNLHPMALKLSPVCLFLLTIYPLMKRFSIFCHLILGMVLALGPIGAWVAIAGEFHPGVLALGAGIMFWVHGFDILYALQDEEFDRKNGLHSIPAKFGSRRARILAAMSHALVPVLWWVCGLCFEFGLIWQVGMGIIALTLLFEHRLVLKDLQKNIGLAFFRLNSVISVGALGLALLEVYL